MRKKFLAVLALGAAFTLSLGFAACGGKDNGISVKFMDGNKVIKTVSVKKGEKVSEIEAPEKTGGYEFVDWFATPTFTRRFDFNTKITESISIYAGYSLFENDTREFYVLGSGTSELLFTSNWGKVITADHKLTKDANKNEYTITMDVKAGDEFQFALNSSWENKRGFGYLETLTLADGTEVFSGQGSPYDDSAKGQNIKCEYSGNYTFTLTTHPNEDYYNTSAPSYTEENKEVYNLSKFDTIKWVRNGDVKNDTVTITDFYIKGAGITAWKDMYNTATQMTRTGTSYSLSIYLKAGEEFMFTSRVAQITSSGTEYSVGADYIKYENIADEASKAFVTASGSNIKANKAGNYTFTYDGTTKKVTIAFEETAAPAARDFYLDGKMGGKNFGEFINTPANYKLTKTSSGSGVYEIKNVTLAAGEEILIRAFVAGTVPGWEASRTDYQYAFLAPNDAFEAASATNNNIKVKTAGTYNIQFDSYSNMIIITPVA